MKSKNDQYISDEKLKDVVEERNVEHGEPVDFIKRFTFVQ